VRNAYLTVSTEQITEMSESEVDALHQERTALTAALKRTTADVNPATPVAVEVNNQTLDDLLAQARKVQTPALTSLSSLLGTATGEQRQALLVSVEDVVAPKVAKARRHLAEFDKIRKATRTQVDMLQTTTDWAALHRSIAARPSRARAGASVGEFIGTLQHVVADLQQIFLASEHKELRDSIVAAEALTETDSPSARAVIGGLEFHLKRIEITVGGVVKKVEHMTRALAALEAEVAGLEGVTLPLAPKRETIPNLPPLPVELRPQESSVPALNQYVGVNFPAEGR
jgi:hypothetical protein